MSERRPKEEGLVAALPGGELDLSLDELAEMGAGLSGVPRPEAPAASSAPRPSRGAPRPRDVEPFAEPRRAPGPPEPAAARENGSPVLEPLRLHEATASREHVPAASAPEPREKEPPPRTPPQPRLEPKSLAVPSAPPVRPEESAAKPVEGVAPAPRTDAPEPKSNGSTPAPLPPPPRIEPKRDRKAELDVRAKTPVVTLSHMGSAASIAEVEIEEAARVPAAQQGAEALAIDELGVELAYGVARAAREAEEAPVEPLFRADIIPGADEETLLPFVIPEGGRVQRRERREAPAPPPPWYERFFDVEYFDLEPQPSARTTKREVDFAIACFNLAQGARILDLCCGFGRHTIELAARGYEVVGLDLSRAMLERSVQESRARKLAVDFVHGDVRNLAFRRLFDGVLFWGTSFGYFRDVENALVLRKVAQALRPGGRVLLQVVNRDFVLRDLPRTQWRRMGDALILDEFDFDWRSSRFRVRRSVLRADGRERIDTLDFRGYSLHELLELLGAEGFVPLEVSGRITARGAYLGTESPSIIVLAEIR